MNANTNFQDAFPHISRHLIYILYGFFTIRSIKSLHICYGIRALICVNLVERSFIYIVRYLPIQLLLLDDSWYPTGHRHTNEPWVFSQIFSHPPLFTEHSSRSGNRGTINIIKT